MSGAFPALYSNIAKCYEELGDFGNAQKNRDLATSFSNKPADKGPFYHGTRANLKVGDLLTPGGISNYDSKITMNHIYFTALVIGQGWQPHWPKVMGLNVFILWNLPAAMKMTQT